MDKAELLGQDFWKEVTLTSISHYTLCTLPTKNKHLKPSTRGHPIEKNHTNKHYAPNPWNHPNHMKAATEKPFEKAWILKSQMNQFHPRKPFGNCWASKSQMKHFNQENQEKATMRAALKSSIHTHFALTLSNQAPNHLLRTPTS